MAGSKEESFASLFESAPKQGFARRPRVGDVLDLEVVGASPEAVLVALDGKQEAFVDPADLTGTDGKLTVSVGSRIAVRVVAIDRTTGETELSPVSKDPVMSVASTPTEAAQAGPTGTPVVVGMRVKGNVAGVERYGVFLEFAVPGAPRPERGLVPTSELGVPRGADLRKGFPLGKELEAVVIAIDERGRIRLSLTALRDAEERRAFETYAAAEKSDDKSDKRSAFGTLADLAKDKKKKK